MDGALKGHGESNGLAAHVKADVLGQADGIVNGVIGGAHGEGAVEAALARVVDLGAGDIERSGCGDLESAAGVVLLGQLHVGGVGNAVQGVGGGQSDVDVQVDGFIVVLHQFPLGLDTAGGVMLMLFFAAVPAPKIVLMLFYAAVVNVLLEFPLGEGGDHAGGLGVLAVGIGHVAHVIGIGVGSLSKCGAHHANDHHDRQQDGKSSASISFPILRCHNFNLLTSIRLE